MALMGRRSFKIRFSSRRTREFHVENQERQTSAAPSAHSFCGLDVLILERAVDRSRLPFAAWSEHVGFA